MDKLIIVSASRECMLSWIEVLSKRYSVIHSDNVETILSEIKKIDSRLLVLDASLIQEMEQLSQLCNCIDKVLVVGECLEANQQIQFIYEGAWGYSEKFIDNQLIVRAVEGILNNEIWLERQLIPQMLQGIVTKQHSVKSNQKFNNESFTTLAVLTQREIQVIELVYNGDDNVTISKTLNITLRTVKAHLSAIFRKFNVQNRFQLVVFLKDLHIGQLANGEDFFRHQTN